MIQAEGMHIRCLEAGRQLAHVAASRIGQLIGGRDHSTVIHSCSTIEQRLKVDKAFVEELNSIEHSFKLKS